MTLLIIVTFLYCLAVLAVLYVILRPQNYKNTSKPFVSVIIAARNESKRIRPLLESLQHLNYPKERYEIIIIDDASEDDTAAIINLYAKEENNLLLICLKEKSKIIHGKKAALKKGIEQAKGTVLLSTDADCTVPKDWILNMVEAFDAQTNMVLGHSLLIKRKGFLDKLLRFDNLFSGIMVAAPTLMGFPFSSVGRNIAFTKDAYIKSGGYNSLKAFKSGDDVHLTELFREKLDGVIRFVFASYPKSKTPDSITEVINQQIRKNSKLLKKSGPTVLFSVALFLYHVGLFTYPFFGSNLFLWACVLFAKFFIEFITLSFTSRKFAETSLIPFIPIMQILYPSYVILLAIAGSFQLYTWKK